MVKKIPLVKKGKHKKHDAIVNDFESQKNKKLEQLATQTIKNQDKMNALKSKYINTDFLNLF
jgi:hypothetical protein